MQNLLLALLVAVATGSAVLADPLRPAKPDYTTPPHQLPPARRAAGNPCAAFGAGFVKVEGTDTCVKIGGAFSVGVGGAVRSR